MANIIKPKRSNTAAKVPTTTELISGELGVNMADRKVYINNGTAVVQVGAGNLSGLGDVAIATPTNGQALTYNSTSGKWENTTSGGSGTVTSVGITPGTGVTVSNSPITTSGNIAVGLSTKLTAIENLSGAGFITQNGTGVIAERTLQAGTGISIAHGNGSSQDPIITNSAPDQTVALTGAGATTISGTYPNFTISSVNTTYGAATSTVPGLIELGSDTAQTVAANAVSATASRSYALQVNAAGQGVVNVPWTDTNSGGTVTSVGGTGTVSGLSLSGTVTTSGNLTLGGTLAVTPSNFASQTANTVLAAPNGAAGVPTFRAIVAADIPTLNQNTTGTAANVTGTVAVANGGTGATTAAGALTNLGAYAATNPSGYITTAGARSAVSFTAGSGAYNSTTGVFTIPTNTNQLTNGAGFVTSSGVTSVATGTGLSGGTITTTGTISLANTTVTAGSYTNTNITVDAQGRITAASSGSSGGVSSFNTRTGAVTLSSGDVTGALGYTPYNSTNPSGYITNGAATAFPAGTVMMFAQTAAPTGWTKSTTHDNKALRVVSGTAGSGGSVAFTTAFASQGVSGSVSVGVSAGTLSVGAGTLGTGSTTVSGSVGGTTLSSSQIPSHTHETPVGFVGIFGTGSSGYRGQYGGAGNGSRDLNGTTGGGGSHDHSFSGGSHNHSITGSPSLSGSPSVTSASFSGTAINLAVQYVDVIIATKN